MGWTGALAALLACGAPSSAGAQDTPPEWQPAGRVRAYGRGLFGPAALVGIGVSSALDQSRSEPPEWGDDFDGLVKRVGSNAGRNAAQETIEHALAALMDRSVVYQKCTCSRTGARIAHAFVETVTDRDREGDRMIALPRFAGAYGGSLIERTWRPDREGIDVLKIGTNTVVYSALGNLWKEFVGWP
jgi:hypothetical protein